MSKSTWAAEAVIINDSLQEITMTTTAVLPVDQAINSLIEAHGPSCADRISQGVQRVARPWTEADGNDDEFIQFCKEYFVSDVDELTRLRDRFETCLEQVGGHLYEMRRYLRRWSDLRGDEFAGVDDIMATFDPAPDLPEQLYKQKLAFIALLNFDRPHLGQLLEEGEHWTDEQWTDARISLAFGPRVPAEINDLARKVRHEARAWVSDFHIPVGSMVDASGKTWFDEDRKLLAHWLIREQIKAGYNEEGGIARQRALMWVMARHIDGTIPTAILNGEAKGLWNPQDNTIDGTQATELMGLTRYDHLIENFHVEQRLDEYYVEHPTAIARKFELAREIPEDDVEALLIELLSTPVRSDLAAILENRLGRPLEPHDIYCEQLTDDRADDEMNALVKARFADHKDFESQLPTLLRELGYNDDDADFLGNRVQVEICKGAGHAMRPLLTEYNAWLRTSSLDGELGWDGFSNAMHELGHNLEQMISSNWAPRPALSNVPNTACTEAFAFLYQSLARKVIGLEATGNEFLADAAQTMLMACQIAGPSLVELYLWRWLYANPKATPEQARAQTIAIADDVWRQYFEKYYGPDSYAILAAYQHMIMTPLYLCDYTIGHIISHQVRSHMQGKDLAAETIRICSIGQVTPDLWMKRAVGSPISVAPLIEDAQRAIPHIS